MNPMLKFALTGALIAIFAYAAVVALLVRFRNFIIFPAPKASYKTAQMFLPLSNGEKIAARWLPSDCEDAPVILYSHGNGEDLGDIAEVLKTFNLRGFSVMAYDYIGYGQSAGKPDESKIYLAADAVWNWLVNDMNIAPRRIAIVGYSLGSAAASHLAQKHDNARCLIISGGFSDGINAIIPFRAAPVKILDNASKLAHTKLPTLIIHGTKDRIVPPRNARKNFASVKSAKKKLTWLEGVGHANTDAENYFDELASFINNPRL